MRNLVLRAALIVSATFSTTPISGEGLTDIAVKVRLSDLDLSKAGDVKTLYRRVGRAVGVACGSSADVRYLELVRQVDACRESSLKQARTKILFLSAQARQGVAVDPGANLQLTFSAIR
jgi:UrcA family protein